MPPANASTAAKRIAREVKQLSQKDALPQGCKAGPTEESIFEWTAQIEGPPDSVYEGGVYDIHLLLPNDFPFRPPRVTFKTKIYHCNINSQGLICLDILKSNWSPALSIVKVLLSISSMLADPNPDDPLVPDIAQKFLKDRKTHDKTAREWTERFAKPKGGASSRTKAAPAATKRSGPIEVITIDDDDD